MTTLQHKLNRQLAHDLREILHEPSFIYVDSIEPEHDRLPVPRGLLEGMAEALHLADRKIAALETMLRPLAQILRETVQHYRDEDTARIINTLNKVEEALR